jgi:hypothetical protein
MNRQFVLQRIARTLGDEVAQALLRALMWKGSENEIGGAFKLFVVICGESCPSI